MSTATPTDETKASPMKYVVRCGSLRTLHVATSKSSFHYGEKVIVRTDRGMETGEVLVEATEHTLSHMTNPPGGQILRSLSGDDVNDLSHISDQGRKEFDACKRHIHRLGLDMKLVDIEHLFGGERVVVYYLADKRVDFRQLVRDLASEFQTRVEMRQIGVRDEAKLLADYGDCGKPVCCNTHLSAMPPVSMRMAKLQKATLDPSKISGRCGRLKCCLRYEFDTYEEMQRELPPPGAQVLTRDGKATVIFQEILAQQLLVQTEDNRRVLIDVSDVLSVVQKKPAGDNRSSSKSKKKQNSKNLDTPSKAEGEENL
ncbi:hypothetical protein CA51_14540 [Rosistilla oblonga]|uniref:PSP1 C-terminal domain-containing protein n=1 Tax=Rosistilla oblonga TaxID=2527990 RepID=A0A518IR58_9BACT|nr:regulatory iron-sulfur-containing complex subunit RicT [Rosistilla oblonga]QDV11584.1 hypothetical protein CA51_14540 [Rosistilla oblonga]QDV55575.1 hypothetical protein Mal33_15520 [Rosistilla oblonga]